MGTYKETTLLAKAARKGIVEQRPLLPKARKERPVVLEYRIRKLPWNEPPGEWGPWKTWGRYINRNSAQQSMTKRQNERWMKDRYEYRIKD